MKKIGGVGMIKTKFVFAVSVFALLAVNSAWAGAPSSGEALGAAHDVFTEQSPTEGVGIAGVSYVIRAVNVAGAAAQEAEAHAAAAGAAAAEAKSALAGKQDVLGYTPEDVANKLTGESVSAEQLTADNYMSAKTVNKFVDTKMSAISTNVGNLTSDVKNLKELTGELGDLAFEDTVSVDKVMGLATVATSGSYNDLTNKPTIPAGELASKNTIKDEDVAADAAIAQSKISGLTADLAKKQDTINDLADIRAGAEKGASSVQSVVSGKENGTISVDGTDVAVKGLGSAAYTASTAYATAAQGTLAASAVQPGTLTSELAKKQDTINDLATIRSNAAAGAAASAAMSGKQDALGYIAEDVANKLTGDSVTAEQLTADNYMSAKTVNKFVDTKMSAISTNVGNLTSDVKNLKELTGELGDLAFKDEVESGDIVNGAVTAVKTSGVIGKIPKGSATATDYANIWVQ